ncbi:hypothetical protein BOTBODRAFT_100481 [Botryobasidium botryosum FD-172 SS1]|uniref:Partial AB-hydrolase lipase domain-containing protein n=1 Tax=Botryobasidium botryosum (strain FD-172 SS1) TaxID=930990 RepID=A0A067N8H2_BOTB1|nr:hypothetical protein BOTBODRAFT_100481 [Botryobasidium botryosum FD-172 SS1]
MPPVPLIGRLSLREYTAIVAGFTLLAFESLIRIATLAMPTPIIAWFHDYSRAVFHMVRPPSPRPPSKTLVEVEHENAKHVERIRTATSFTELCAIYGYEVEEHVVHTKDGYLLGLHRLPCRRGEKKALPGTPSRKPVVYLHHGLLMNSEGWVCLTTAERCIPFVLVEAGYDVWLGNNRGNKYSRKCLHAGPNTRRFWNFSIDEFCLYDIPDSVAHVLRVTRRPSLSYVGFSQGTAQAFAALSTHPELNHLVNVFIALAPAMSPAGLATPVVDALMKASPTLMYLLFGRKSILSSVVMWQSILYPPIFTSIIDLAVNMLFSWESRNITAPQKLAAYAHLFSHGSVKAVVHWFQIMRNGAFQLYDDDVQVGHPSKRAYHPIKFPTRNIATPIVLLYGQQDSLVDIDTMLAELPEHTIATGLPKYEHIDVLWGDNIHNDVIPHVLEALEKHSSE